MSIWQKKLYLMKIEKLTVIFWVRFACFSISWRKEMFSQQEQDQQRGRDQQERIQWKNSYFNDKDVSQSFYLFACNWQFIIIELIIFSQYSQITIDFSTRTMPQLVNDYLEIGRMKWMFAFVELILILALSYSVFWSNDFKMNQQLSVITLWLLSSLNSWNYNVRMHK